MAAVTNVTITETAVNNTEVALTLQSDVTRIRFSAPIDFEVRLATGAVGAYCAKEDNITIEGASNWRGATIYLWSAGNNAIHTMQESGTLG